MRFFALSVAACAAFLLAGSGALAAPAWPDLSRPPAATGGGAKDAAVVVGIDKYLLVSEVPGATDNAADWFAWLTETRGVPYERVHLLRDTEAARERILKAAEQAAEEVERGGTLWFVFIGHGAPSKDQKDGLLVGVDANQDALSLYSRSVAQKELLEALGKGKQARTVVLVDSCFSGRTQGGGALAPGLQPLLPVKLDVGQAIVITAGKSNEFAGPLPKTRRPAFSYLMLGALRGWGDANGDGRVSVKEAVRYAQKTLRAVAKDRIQTPQHFGVGGDLILADRARERGPHLGSIILGRDVRAADPVKVAEAPSEVEPRPKMTPIPTRPDPPETEAPARSAEDEAAKALYEQATKAYIQGNLGLARKLMRQSAEKGKRPELWFNVGVIEEKLGDDAAAAKAYQRYLKALPNGSRASHVRQRLQALEAKAAPKPATKRVKVTPSKIEILQKVFFRTGKPTIPKASYLLLDEVASVLKAYPELKIRVEGHTDSRGNARYNKKLSEKRAAAVVKYLTGKGVDPSRLTAVGYGEERPIMPNDTAEGRSKNNRVEFRIVDLPAPARPR